MTHPNDIVHLKQTCTACPSQWEGRLADGTHFYVRFRSNRIRIGFGATEVEALERGIGFRGYTPDYEHNPPGGNPLDGYMTWNEMAPHFEQALANFRERLSGVARNPGEE